MSDVAPPEPTLPELTRRDPWTVWSTTTSLLLHLGLLVILVWQPPPGSVDAAPPPAIDVELVPAPEAASASEPPVEEPAEEASAPAPPPTETTPAEPPPPEPATAPAPSAAETSPPETPSETAAPAAAPEPATSAPQPARSAERSAEAPPIPLSRPRVRGLAAPTDAPDAGASALTADTGEMAEGAAPAPSAEPDAAILALGPQRVAERFFLEAMLSSPGMARARDMLETLPPEKRLAQTCNIEALAQVGNAGEDFAPDVVMAEAYALSEVAGTHLAASGAIFRSAERWYGLAFDCTLSDDLTRVTAFSYRLGADVTDAVLARLGRN